MRLYLSKKKIKFRAEHIILKSKKRSKPRYDFYLPELRTLIEFDGRQHFEHVRYFHRTVSKFNRRRQADVRKTREALKQGYRLIRIDYACLRNIETHLDFALSLGNQLCLSSTMYKKLLPTDLIELSSLKIRKPQACCDLIIE